MFTLYILNVRKVSCPATLTDADGDECIPFIRRLCNRPREQPLQTVTLWSAGTTSAFATVASNQRAVYIVSSIRIDQ